MQLSAGAAGACGLAVFLLAVLALIRVHREDMPHRLSMLLEAAAWVSLVIATIGLSAAMLEVPRLIHSWRRKTFC